jgi:uncharacterized protein YggE
MKRYFLAIAFVAITATASASSGQETGPCRALVSTVGSAEIRVVPDLADLSFEVQVRDTDLSKARKEQAERITKVLTALRQVGITESELQTSQVHLTPEYQNREESPFGPSARRRPESVKVVFYNVSQSISCTLHDVSKVPNVTADALAAGVTAVYGASLRTSQLRKYRDQARAMAIRSAKEKAVALASELGAKVGRPFTITEHSVGYRSPSNFNNSIPMQRSVAAPFESDGTAPGFAPGTISVDAQVSVSFILE